MATAISSDNTLVTLASSAYKTKIENKLNSYLAKVGIRQGSAVFTFTEAGEFTITNGTKQIASGTYTVDKENNVEMKFGKVYSYLTLKGKLAATTSGCQILFNADKFLEFLKKAVAVAGKLISTDSLASLLSDASGLQLLKVVLDDLGQPAEVSLARGRTDADAVVDVHRTECAVGRFFAFGHDGI